MAAPKIIKLSNGATLIYSKQNATDITEMCIGFSCGARVDEIPGMSHFLEHMLFVPNKEFEQNINESMRDHSQYQNASTSNNEIVLNFSCVNKELKDTLKYNVNMIKNRKFDKANMDNEISVIEQEIAMYKDKKTSNAISELINCLNGYGAGNYNDADPILGDVKSLKKITPVMLKEYMDKYFITDNLVVGVNTNLSVTQIKELLEKELVSKLKSKPENKIDPIENIFYVPKNFLIAKPNAKKSGVVVKLLLREDGFYEDEFSVCLRMILGTIMNSSLGGKLHQKFRKDNNTVRAYSYGYAEMDLAYLNLNILSVTTSPKKVKKAMDDLINVIKDLSVNGITKKEYNFAIKKITESYEAQKYDEGEYAEALVSDYLWGLPTVHYQDVQKYLPLLNYQEVNEAIKAKFSNKNVLATVEGNFDPRHIYNLIEIEMKLGNKEHKNSVRAFDKDVIQGVTMVDCEY